MGISISSFNKYLNNLWIICCSSDPAEEASETMENSYSTDTIYPSDSDEPTSSSNESENELLQKAIFSKDNKKRALIIGINYFETEGELSGCINDVIHLKLFLESNLYFKPSDILEMRDDLTLQSLFYPNYFNIIKQIDLLVEWANNNKNSEIWLSYSGHGSNIYDFNGDEIDGRDEVLCTADHKYIKDDWLKTNFINLLNKDVKVFILIDACHSGTMCDLTYDEKKNIVMMSGCRDDQTSADAYMREEQEYRGALTYTFLKCWDNKICLKELHETILSTMNNRFTQKSVLSYTNHSLPNFHLCL